MAAASWLRLPPPDKVRAETSVVEFDGLRQVVTHRMPTRHGFDICCGSGANGAGDLITAAVEGQWARRWNGFVTQQMHECGLTTRRTRSYAMTVRPQLWL